MDRQRARTCPRASEPGGRGSAGCGSALLAVLSVAACALLAASPPASAAPAAPAPAAAASASAPALVLTSQSGWVTPGQDFDLHLRPASTHAGAALGVTVAVYSCLSSVSAFDQSVTAAPSGTPVSSTVTPVALSGLPALGAGAYDLRMPVVVGGTSSAPTAAAPFTIHLRPVAGQCQSFPQGVFPVRIQLVDTADGTTLGSFTTHLVYSEAPASTQRLRAAVVVPVQTTQVAARVTTPAALVARPSSALATPSDAALAQVTGTVATIADQHPTVPVTLQVSGQTVSLLAGTSHQAALAQLQQIAASPDVHQLTAAPYTPVDAAALVGAGLGAELGLQVARGTAVVAAATGRAAPDATTGLGPWITGDGLDSATVGTLAADGFRQVVLPASALSSSPTDGSTAQPFLLPGARSTTVTALAANDDLTQRFTADPGDPVLAAHQLAAELAQFYFERPNGESPRAVAAVAPTTWAASPAFVDALLGSLDGNPLVQPVTVSQLFALFPSPATCRSGCRLTSAGNGAGLPATAIRAQRSRVTDFAASTEGTRALAQQLGDLVLGSQAQALRPGQQSAVAANAGAALDAQLGQLAVEGDQSVTLTARSGLIPVTVVSNASYPVTATLVLSSDKLLFPNGETQYSRPVTLLPRHSNVFYVRVRTRTSGSFRLDVTLHASSGALRLVSGELTVRSTSSSVVGVILTAGAVVVLAAWWFRTSQKRRALRRAEESADEGPLESQPADETVPTP